MNSINQSILNDLNDHGILRNYEIDESGQEETLGQIHQLNEMEDLEKAYGTFMEESSTENEYYESEEDDLYLEEDDEGLYDDWETL